MSMQSHTPPSAEFIAELKALILEAAEKSEPAGGLQNDEPLFGAQISMAIQKRYGVRMPDSKDTRRALESITHLAEHLHQHLASNTKPA
jgi:acyl carrier protein